MDQSRADQPAVVLPDRNHIVRDLSLLAGDRYIIAEMFMYILPILPSKESLSKGRRV